MICRARTDLARRWYEADVPNRSMSDAAYSDAATRASAACDMTIR